MTSRELLLAFKDGTLSKRDVRDRLQALRNLPRKQPLSEGQRGLWALQRLEPELDVYNLALGFGLGSELDVDRLQQACRLLLERFPILTTVFGEEDGVPFRIEQAAQPLSFEREDISTLAPVDVLPHLRARVRTPFSLDHGPLMRVHLFTRGSGAGAEHLLLIVVHHIIFDGASLAPLVTNLFDAYRDLTAGRDAQPSASPAPYADFVDWERQMLASEAGAEHLAYWARQLAEPLPLIDLPTDRRRSELGTTGADAAQPGAVEAHVVSERLSPELTRALQAVADSQRVSVSVLFLALFNCLLQRHTGQDELIVGMPTIGTSSICSPFAPSQYVGAPLPRFLPSSS
jgi:polyketide synthase PksN